MMHFIEFATKTMSFTHWDPKQIPLLRNVFFFFFFFLNINILGEVKTPEWVQNKWFNDFSGILTKEM